MTGTRGEGMSGAKKKREGAAGGSVPRLLAPAELPQVQGERHLRAA